MGYNHTIMIYFARGAIAISLLVIINRCGIEDGDGVGNEFIYGC